MNHVWVVLWEFADDEVYDSGIGAIFSNEDAAEEWASRKRKVLGDPSRTFYVECWHVHEDVNDVETR